MTINEKECNEHLSVECLTQLVVPHIPRNSQNLRRESRPIFFLNFQPFMMQSDHLFLTLFRLIPILQLCGRRDERIFCVNKKNDYIATTPILIQCSPFLLSPYFPVSLNLHFSFFSLGCHPPHPPSIKHNLFSCHTS